MPHSDRVGPSWARPSLAKLWSAGRFSEIIALALPATESGTPGLILQKEFRQLQQGKQRLQGSCWRVGPYADEATVSRAWQSLEYIALDVQKRRITPAGKTLYELSVPASSNREAAALVAESLATTGIRSPDILPDHSLFLGR